jgi:hypothetical protein
MKLIKLGPQKALFIVKKGDKIAFIPATSRRSNKVLAIIKAPTSMYY